MRSARDTTHRCEKTSCGIDDRVLGRVLRQAIARDANRDEDVSGVVGGIDTELARDPGFGRIEAEAGLQL